MRSTGGASPRAMASGSLRHPLRLLRVLAVIAIVGGCGPSPSASGPAVSASVAAATATGAGSGLAPWKDASAPLDLRVETLLAAMTLDEKIGQMTQIEIGSVNPESVRSGLLGSVLSGGDGNPRGENDAEHWYRMVAELQGAALRTRLGIPILYGIDAVHGDAHLTGTTVFPHNVGMGATRDPDLVKRACAVTAAEMNATGVRWAFAPMVTVPLDVRWGRTYEGYGENTDLVAVMGAACLQGLQGEKLTDPNTVVGDPKAYLGDGGTAFGTSTGRSQAGPYLLDQGVAEMDDETIERRFLPPYEAAVKSGARIVMASFSSTRDGGRIHGDRHWLTDVLKTRLGFTGFVVSDWGGVDQVSPDYSTAVAQAINAGIDMNMVPSDWKAFESTLRSLVRDGEVAQTRIDDAVRRILRVKFEMGLFESPMPPSGRWAEVGSDANRAVARRAVAESAVLLKTTARVLPVAKTAGRVYLSGPGGDDIGIAAGGWTISWQGQSGDVTAGTTIREGLAAQLGDRLVYAANGDFGAAPKADVGIVVVAERPYAEGVGDSRDLLLPASDTDLVAKMKSSASHVIVVVISGRPVILGNVLSEADAIVEAWQFGTEGAGVADVLLGASPFTGTTPYTWPRSPGDAPRLTKGACDGAVFPYGYGLDATGMLLGPAACEPE